MSMDKDTFKRYKQKKIDSKKCLDEFYENNRIPLDLRNIEEQEFIKWLESIGY